MTKIIAVSGKKSSGKTTLCNYLQAYLYAKENNITKPKQLFDGEIIWKSDTCHDYREINPDMNCNYGLYNFADTLKQLCVDVLGLTPEQVWGTEAQKNTLTPFQWEKIPAYVRWVAGGKKVENPEMFNQKETDEETYSYALASHPYDHNYPKGLKSGNMTARETMQLFGTDIMRRMFCDNIWVESTMRKIKKENKLFAFIGDMRFKTEFHSVHNMNGFIIRLERTVFPNDHHYSEIDFNGFDFSQYSRTLVVPEVKSIEEKNKIAVDWLENVVLKEENDD